MAEPEIKLPPGVKLLRTLRGHTAYVGRIAWSPDGRMLASPSAYKTIQLDAGSGTSPESEPTVARMGWLGWKAGRPP